MKICRIQEKQMLCLLICFFLLLSYDVSSTQIAICVSGQISRWLPEYLLTGVIQANKDHVFHLFINLQYHLTDDISSVFTTSSALSFEPTPVNKMKSIELLNYIHSLYSTKNSQIASIEFVPPRTLSDWKKSMALLTSQDSYTSSSASSEKEGSLPDLDRISLYTKKQHAILNLYSHQMRCYEQIKTFEVMNGVKIDYVINTREDIFYFQPIILAKLLPNHQSSNGEQISVTSREPGASKPYSFVQNSLHHSFCDIVVKNCLKWNGTNMRWQLFSRDLSSSILQNRLNYYLYLYKINATFHNPEIFELNQYKHYQLNICEYSVDEIPATAVRYAGSAGSSCFIAQEIGDRCVPTKFQKFVKENNCNLFINSTGGKGLRKNDATASEIGNRLAKKAPQLAKRKTGL
jgi:hypothetical protein